MKKHLSLILRLAVSALLIYFIAKSVDFSSLWELLRQARLSFAAAGLGCVFLAMTIGAYKWQILANTVYGTALSFGKFFRYSFVGFFYSMFVPGGLLVGEFMKGLRVVNGERQKPELVLSILMDRITGFISLGILLAAAFYLHPVLWTDRLAVLGLLVSAAIFLLGLGLLVSRRFVKFWFATAKFFHTAASGFEDLFLAYQARRGILAWSVLLSCVIHVLWGAGIYLGSLALGMDFSMSYLTLLYLLSGILFLIPATYAGFGAREWVFVYFLGLMNVPSESALALSLMFFGLQLGMAFIGGFFELRQIR